MATTMQKLLFPLFALIALQPLSAMDANESSDKTEGWQEELDSNLCEAITDSGLEQVAKLLRDGANINARDEQNSTPLIHACKHFGKTENLTEKIIEYLIHAHADINAQNNSGTTALMMAAELKRDGICSLLLDHRANVNLYTKHGHTALTGAAQWGTEFICTKLMQAGASLFPSPIKTSYARTALIYAAIRRRETLCQLMVTHQKRVIDGTVLALLYFKNHENSLMRFLYREQLLKPYLEKYTLKQLLMIEDLVEKTAHYYLAIDCLKPCKITK
jgi:hypothetical protein